MVLTAQRCYSLIRHGLGGSAAAEVALQDVLNSAGHFLVNMHPWTWLRRPAGALNIRAPITIDNGTWTEATKTLTKTAAFASYTFVRGDTFRVTAGADATQGFYPIKSKTSADAIVLDTSIGAAANGDTDIDGTLDASSIALPSDFRSLISLELDRNYPYSVTLTTMADILHRRTWVPYSDGAQTWVALTYAPPPAAGGEPIPVLQTYPGATAALVAGMRIAYVAGWQEITDDNAAVSIPRWLEGPLIDIARVYAKSLEEEDVASRTERLQAIMQSPELRAAMDRDGDAQTDYGPLLGGAAMQHCGEYAYPARFTVADP